MTQTTSQHLITSSGHHTYRKVPKFKEGDLVKIVQGGHGCHPNSVGNIVKIIKIVDFTLGEWTYLIDNKTLETNAKSNYQGGKIWEQSFELVSLLKPKDVDDLNKKIKNISKMAKVKNLTKNKAQEVRTINTSLINKEEVFKMLALAEATQLPCLLVGAPGK